MIRFEDVTVVRNGEAVLSGFNLDVAAGEKVLIYGKSGIGKSTVLGVLLGFVRPDSGDIFFDGELLDRKRVWEVRRRVAYVGQDPDVSEETVSGFIEGVLHYGANRSVPRSEAKRASVFDLLELEPGILCKSMSGISGGERQRVVLAAALLLERDVFLLDEVTSHIDAGLKRKVVGHFASMEGATVLVVSHDPHWLEGNRLKVVRLGGS